MKHLWRTSMLMKVGSDSPQQTKFTADKLLPLHHQSQTLQCHQHTQVADEKSKVPF